MTTLREITKFREKNTRCYYVDSDGDEVIVSDEEDYEVAIEYLKTKGEGKIKLIPTKRQDDDSEEEEYKEPPFVSKDSFNMVQETTSVNGDDDSGSDLSDNDEKAEEHEGIQIVDSNVDLAKQTTEKNEVDRRFDANIQETVSRDSSIYYPSENGDAKEKHGNENSNIDCSILNEMEVVSKSYVNSDTKHTPKIEMVDGAQQEGVHDYQPCEKQEDEKIENSDDEHIQENDESEDKKQDPVSDEKEEEPKEVEEIKDLADSKRKSEIAAEENLLSEMNKTVDPSEKEAILEEQVVGDSVKEEGKEEPKEPVFEPEEIKETVSEHSDDYVDEEEEEEKKEEFLDQPRLGVSMSCAKAKVVDSDDKKKINYLNRAIDNINFVFNHPNKRQKIAKVDECDEERSQDYVVTCKPGERTKKRWRVVNKSNIPWPKNTVIKCENKDVEAEIPKIVQPLCPGEKLDISINIKIDENETENTIKIFVFRFYSKIYGHFGSPLTATVEVIPDLAKNPIDHLSQEEKLKEIMEGDEINPILYGIANDFVEEGMGTFDQCLESLMQWRGNFEAARASLEAQANAEI